MNGRFRTAKNPYQVGLALLTAVFAMGGCQSTNRGIIEADARVTRLSRNGNEALAEGQLSDSVAAFRKAIHRAWAMDDPAEAGTNAYNLAAALISDGKSEQANDWLIDARVELCRAGQSPGNAILLQSKIAQADGRLADAEMLINQAACVRPPCPSADSAGCNCCGDDPCQDSCLTKIPCVGDRVAERKAAEECATAYEAQILLARARVAADRFDIPCAIQYFCDACDLAQDVCSNDLQAELQHVAGRIHMAKGECYQAARHFDREAKYLRRAANYREIPSALGLSAAAYAQVQRFDLAADRWCRVARIWMGRGDLKRAWDYLKRSLMYAELRPDNVINVRLALLANEIEVELTETGGSLKDFDESEMMSASKPFDPPDLVTMEFQPPVIVSQNADFK